MTYRKPELTSCQSPTSARVGEAALPCVSGSAGQASGHSRAFVEGEAFLEVGQDIDQLEPSDRGHLALRETEVPEADDMVHGAQPLAEIAEHRRRAEQE